MASEGRDAVPNLSRITSGVHQGTPLIFAERSATHPLLEREREISALAAALDEARAGHGRVVVVEAPAGRGKSALLAALCERAAADGMRVVAGRGGEFEQGFAFGTIRQLFERVVQRADGLERARLLAGAAAPAEPILTPSGPAHAESLLGVLHGIYWLATNLSLERPLMIAVDDLHWTDGESLRALSYLARRIDDLPIALVVALRPAEPGAPHELLDAIRTQPGTSTTRLGPLSRDAVAALVIAAIPEADDALCAACFEASAGNPFYLNELLLGLADAPDADDARHAAIPELGDRIVRRIERLDPGAVALAQAMAVLGDGGSLDDAARLANMEPAAAAAIAAAMKRVEILSAEDPIAFAHPLVRRSVYDALTLAGRDRAHADAARVLREAGASLGVVAAHLGQVRPTGSDEVAGALRAAAQDALSRGAPDAAAVALRRAVEEGAEQPPRATLLHELGHIEVVRREVAAVAHLSEALELADDPVLAARITLDLCGIFGAMGDWERLLSLAAAAIERLGDRDATLLLDLEAVRAGALANDGDRIAEYDRDQERLLALAQGDEWPARALSVLLPSIWAGRGERLGEIRTLVDHGLRDGSLISERGAGAWAAPQAILALMLIDDDERVVEVIDEIASVARRDGSTIGALMAVVCRAWRTVRRGDLALAEGEMQTVMDIAHPNDMQMEIASVYWFLCDAIGERPGLDAFAAETEALELPPAFARTMAGAMMCEVRGRYRCVHGDRALGIADLRAAGAVYRRLRVGPLRSTWRSALAFALRADARDEALELVAEELELARRAGLPRALGAALRAAAVIDGGEDEVDQLRRSVALLETTDARLEHARSLLALGSALRRRSLRAEARESLMAATELAHRCGATATVARALDELRAAGARPRRVAQNGVDALTASEARVARLVAEGCTNAEAAQELYVSLKTIETHLTRIYAKLGLSGVGARGRLAGALSRAA